jgi:hypothetical protein
MEGGNGGKTSAYSPSASFTADLARANHAERVAALLTLHLDDAHRAPVLRPPLALGLFDCQRPALAWRWAVFVGLALRLKRLVAGTPRAFAEREH